MLSRRVTIAGLLVSSLILFASLNVRAQTLISARILSSNGPVEIQRRSQGQTELVKIAYRVNDQLLAGDVIKTLRGGRLVLGLEDSSQAIIGDRTSVEITDLSKSPRTIFNVLRGKTRIKIEKVGGRPNPYRVNTPTAVIAVRGTQFDVFATEKETQVFVQEGEVSVSNFASPEVLVILSPGQRTRVEEARPPEPPSSFRPGRNEDMFNQRPPERSMGGDHRVERGANGRSPEPRGDAPGLNAPGTGAPLPGSPVPGARRGDGRRPPQ